MTFPAPTSAQIEAAYAVARERYAALGVDTEAALETLATVSLSLHCWQGDDVGGFENPGGPLEGGIAATGNYPGKARNGDELRSDLDLVYRLLPGRHRLNLHAIYAETGGVKVSRDELRPEHFATWLDWAKANGHGIDFNPTCFSHPLAADGMTLAHPDPAIRRFWIDHCVACRRIGAHFGRELGTPCVTNIWIPDGAKDTPVDRLGPRQRLRGHSTRFWPSRSIRLTIVMRWKPSSSASVLRAMSLARTNSTSATPSAIPACCSVLIAAISIPPRPSRIKSQRFCCLSMNCCCMSAGACAGIAITS